MAHYVTPSSEAALVLRNSAETITVTFYSAETPTAPNTGSLTVGIVDEGGDTIVAAGTSTTSSSTGVYSYALPAQADLNRLTATWSGTFSARNRRRLLYHADRSSKHGLDNRRVFDLPYCRPSRSDHLGDQCDRRLHGSVIRLSIRKRCPGRNRERPSKALEDVPQEDPVGINRRDSSNFRRDF